ncbi:MAG: hypothetical protein HRT88_15925, partial [Lentisphaeraceae bacterium]|nr:hypothetical protein [Lentisphaeraceae bacterium]
MDVSIQQELIEDLAWLISSEKISPQQALPALQTLQRETPDFSRIIQLLQNQDNSAFTKLSDELCENRRQDAISFYQRHKNGDRNLNDLRYTLATMPYNITCNWADENKADKISYFCQLHNDSLFITQHDHQAPQLARSIQTKLNDTFPQPNDLLESLWIHVSPLEVVDSLWLQADDELRVHLRNFKLQYTDWLQQKNEQARADIEQLPVELGVKDHASYLNALTQYQLPPLEQDNGNSTQLTALQKFYSLVFQWKHRDIAPLMLSLLKQEEDSQYLELLMLMRFGKLEDKNFQTWQDYLTEVYRSHKEEAKSFKNVADTNPAILLYNWCRCRQDFPIELTSALKDHCDKQAAAIDTEQFVWRYVADISAEEKQALLGTEITLEEVEAESFEIPTEIKVTDCEDIQKTVESSEEVLAAQVPQKTERSQPMWKQHMKSFFSDNWYSVIGVILLIAGSSIGYATFGEKWYVRYTFMPAMLMLFTVSLAYLGSWIEKKSSDFTATASILRGAAILMLPLNFMVPAMLANDDQIGNKLLPVLLMIIIYGLAGNWGLRRCCAAVAPALRNSLAGTLLMLNSLLLIAPVAAICGLDKTLAQSFIPATVTYLGFAALSWMVFHFCRNILTASMAAGKRIPWFFAAVLLGTFIQAFGWTHVHFSHLPQVYTYAPLMIISAALMFMTERRAITLQNKVDDKEGESFIGYALIFIGVLMAAPQKYVRILTLIAAGLVWFYQARRRQQLLHYHIALSFFLLAICCIGLLNEFSSACYGALGLCATLLLVIAARISRKHGHFLFVRACNGTQITALLITVFISMTTQWSLGISPLLTAFYLLASAALFAWRSYDDDQLKWLHSSMFVLALTLPYLGCVNLQAKTLEGNTLVFGLAVLSLFWLALQHFGRFHLLRQARSTVLWFYGILATCGMIIHVIAERGAAVDPLWYMAFMDYMGPILMSAILVLASFYSRSLIPAFMAAIISVILFPELKANFRSTFQLMGFGSGFGSACTAMAMIGLCFYLRRVKFLRQLGEGDRFMGASLFPWRRYDHTLFTWPLMISAVFLVIKTATVNLLRQLVKMGDISIKGAIA